MYCTYKHLHKRIYIYLIQKGCKETFNAVTRIKKREASSVARRLRCRLGRKETANNLSVLLYYSKLAEAPSSHVRGFRFVCVILPTTVACC